MKIDTKGFKDFLEVLEKVDTGRVCEATLNEGVQKMRTESVENTERITGDMRRAWDTTPTIRSGTTYSKSLINDEPYSGWVEKGHNTILKKDGTRGWVPGQHIALKAKIHYERNVNKIYAKHFKKEFNK